MTTSTLLGYLARFGTFTMQSELLCTQGLAYLLNAHAEAYSALAEEIEARTGNAIDDSLTWVPEALQKDGGRPDLEGRTAEKVPWVKIEAKLGAELSKAQVRSYVVDLHRRNSGESVLLVLVPAKQSASVTQVIIEEFGLSGAGPWRVSDKTKSRTVVISIITWNKLFEVLQSGESERFRYELEQLKSMYDELSSDFIAPLASDEELSQWMSSETNFVKLVDQLTRRLTKQHRLYPMFGESLEPAQPDCEPREYRLRYVCPCADDASSCYSIGVRDSFAKWVTPIWMRFHKDTSNFILIRQRIELSDLKSKSVVSGGHVWIPLDVPRDVAAEKMIEALATQVKDILRVAYQAE